ncbi:MAG: hypothetical protein IT555_10785 [Acetobacteraceae bacterium]|nr:hypothetical protein [Acetobacteraceae bacterium]
MIDMFALLVSTGMLGIVVFFAIRLNREREWFERPKAPRPPAPVQRRTSRSVFRR